MTIIKWSPGLEIGIELIDDQHRGLVELVNMLHETVHSSDMSPDEKHLVLEEILSDLISYTKMHFRSEEEYMEEINYPDLDSHRKEHERFTGAVGNFRDKFQEGGEELLKEVSEYMADWLIKHVKGRDSDLKNYKN